MSKLEDLVPPLKLCRMILSERAFAHTALAWVCIGEIKKEEEWILVENNCALIYALGGHYTTPAPTLAEILEALENHGSVFTRRDDDGWMVMLEIAGDDEGYGYDAKIERDPDNAASAALRLWLEVNGVEVKDE